MEERNRQNQTESRHNMCWRSEQRKISLRKEALEETILKKRGLTQNKPVQPHERPDVKMEAEVIPQKERERKRSRKPNKSDVVCWHCNRKGHMKGHCPEIRCFVCYRRGHTKNNCILHLLKQSIYRQNTQPSRAQEALEEKRRTKREEEADRPVRGIDKRLNGLRLEDTGREQILVFDGSVKLGIYSGPRNEEPSIRSTFNTPQEILEMRVSKNVKAYRIEGLMNGRLLHHCNCGEVFKKADLIKHCTEKHYGFILKDTHLNLLLVREWTLWDDEDDCINLINNKERNYKEYYSNYS